MATLTVTQSENYIDGNPSVANTDQIVFTNATTALATFSSTQFGGANISNTVGITGNGSTNLIEVQVALDATFSAAGWTSFASWTDATDRVTLVGTTGAETITGSSRADLIEGRAGADTLSGGDGDDIFDYRNGSHLVAGESISGGAGDDSVLLSIGINVDFSLATTFSSIETLRMLASGTSSATFSGTQIGSGAVDTVIGLPTATQAIIVNGNTVNLSGVTFTNWTGANQTITINGTNAGANILFGSNKNDSIIGTGNSIDAMRGGGGADSLTGGGGHDNFNYAAAGEVVAGETILGGSGTDRITLTNAGTNDFSLASINSVETLDLDSGNSTAIFSGAQFAGVLSTMSGSAGTDALIVNAASDVNLSGLTINTWTNGIDTITINGTASNETLTGTSFNDIISGGAGADSISGGAGDDILTIDASDTGVDGGDGNDTVNLTGSGMVFNLAFSNIENANGTAGNDQIDGTFSSLIAALTLNGLGGSDTLSGGGLGDTINGGDGDDSLFGNSGADVINGGAGIDFINGGADGDTIHGDGDNDTIFAEAGNDNIFGDAGNEYAFGGSGNDNLTGGTGTDYMVGDDNVIANTGITGQDTLTGGDDGDTLIGGYDSDNLTGENGSDALYGDFDDVNTPSNPGSADTLTGGEGNDFMFGGGGDDILVGGNDNDTLIGGSGSDNLTGGAGSDSLYGQAGADRFFFGDGWGTDGLWDFADGTEFIDLSAVSGLDTFGQLSITDQVSGALNYADVSFGGNHIFVVGVTAAQLTVLDFFLS